MHLIKTELVVKQTHNANTLIKIKVFVKVVMKVMKYMMGNVQKQIYLKVVMLDANSGKMEIVFNAPKDGFLIKMVFVKLQMIYVENGINMENVKSAIKVM